MSRRYHQPQTNLNSSHFFSSSSSSSSSSLSSSSVSATFSPQSISPSSSSFSSFLSSPFISNNLRQCSSPRPPPLSSLLSPLKCSTSNSNFGEKDTNYNSYGIGDAAGSASFGSLTGSYSSLLQNQHQLHSSYSSGKSLTDYAQSKILSPPSGMASPAPNCFYSQGSTSGVSLETSYNFVQQQQYFSNNHFQPRPSQIDQQHLSGLQQQQDPILRTSNQIIR